MSIFTLSGYLGQLSCGKGEWHLPALNTAIIMYIPRWNLRLLYQSHLQRTWYTFLMQENCQQYYYLNYGNLFYFTLMNLSWFVFNEQKIYKHTKVLKYSLSQLYNSKHWQWCCLKRPKDNLLYQAPPKSMQSHISITL